MSEDLKKQLAELEAKRRACGHHDALREKVKRVFDEFDADNSGYIDAKELAALAKDLGEMMDEDELKAAFDEMDTSHDGKIQFDEFFNWWMLPTRVSKNKGFAHAAAIRAKLEARYLFPAILKLGRQLSELEGGQQMSCKGRIKIGTVNDDGKNTQVTLRIEGIDKPAGLLDQYAELKAGLFGSVDFELCDGVAFGDAKDFVETTKKALKEIALGMGMVREGTPPAKLFDAELAITEVGDGKTMRITFPFPGTDPKDDPTKGIDWKTLWELYKVCFSFNFNVNDVLNGSNLDGKTLMDLIALNVEGSFKSSTDLFAALMMQNDGRQADLFFLTMMRSSNMTLSFNSVQALAAVKSKLNPNNRDTQKFTQILAQGEAPAMMISTMVKQGLQMAQMAIPEPLQATVSAIRKNLKTIKRVSLFTGSGLQGSLELDNFVDLSILPDFSDEAPM